MRRHPVEDDADPRGVAAIDEAGEILGASEPGGGRELRQRLVAPGAAERVLGDRHQLQMGETQELEIGNEPVGGLVPTALLALGGPQPRARMAFVDAHGLARRDGVAPMRDVGVVGPAEGGWRRDDGGRARRELRAPRHRIGLPRQGFARGAGDGELVGAADRHVGDEKLPDTRLPPPPHRMAGRVPAVELSDDGHGLGVRGPDRKADAIMAAMAARLRAEAGGEVPVRAFGEPVQVIAGQHRGESIRVDDALDSAGPVNDEPVVAGLRHHALEDPGHHLRHGDRGPALARLGLHVKGTRQHGADAHAPLLTMGAEHGEGVAMAAALEGGERPCDRALPCGVPAGAPGRGTVRRRITSRLLRNATERAAAH